jgi:ATP-dependent DNA ligase
MHSKVTGGPKDTLYIHDLITHPTEELFGSTYKERYQLILDLLNPEDHGDEDHLVVTPNLWVARNLTKGFREMFNQIKCPWHEGTVLKDPKGRLGNCSKPTSNSGWQVKCRVPHKNYGF